MATSAYFKVTVLVENERINKQLRKEHGLSYCISNGESAGLFDTGQSESVANNAEALDIDLSKLDWVALSHGHYDHGGGLPTVLGASEHSHLYMHPAALWPKFAVEENGKRRNIGLPVSFDFIDNYSQEVHFNTRPQVIRPHITLTGEIPRRTHFESVPKRFQTQSNGKMQPDAFLDDQALLLDSREGLVVLLGCAHAGVVNTLMYIKTITNNQPIHALIGGMHLAKASDEQLETTIDFIRGLDIHLLGPTHCTGSKATEAFQAAFPERFFPCMTGTTIEF